jgi:molybdopterin-guanine dinucleotide biosynthesis protein A
MGAGKATTRLAGRPLISHPIEAARGAGLDVVVVSKPATALPDLDVPVWLEPSHPQHPLLGIVTALERVRGGAVLALGCDLPLLTPELLGWLAGLEGSPAVVPVAAGRPQPLLARYSAEALEPLRQALGSGQTLTAAVAALGPRWVGEGELRLFGDPARLAFNVNTPEDLERAAALFAPLP